MITETEVPLRRDMTVLPSSAGAETHVLPGGALQVLALAQRTADDHVAEANRQAQTIRAEAQASADETRRKARSYALESQAEADRLLASARVEAARIVAGGSDQAEQLKLQAQQRYEDAVGGLAIRREALQKQIEALEIFDKEYRNRITFFLQGQLRALWAEKPQASDVPDGAMQRPGGPVGSPEGG